MNMTKMVEVSTSKKHILFVGNLSYDTTNADLEKLLKPCGKVSVRLLTKQGTSDPRGCGFLEFESAKALQKGLKFHNYPLKDRKIRLQLSGTGSTKEKREKSIAQKAKKLTETRKKEHGERQNESWQEQKKEANKQKSKLKFHERQKAERLAKRGGVVKNHTSSPSSTSLNNPKNNTTSAVPLQQQLHDHPKAQLDNLKKKFKLNKDGMFYLRRQEPWVVEHIEKFCRAPNNEIKDPTGWVIKFGEQVKRENGTMIPRLHPTFSFDEDHQGGSSNKDDNNNIDDMIFDEDSILQLAPEDLPAAQKRMPRNLNNHDQTINSDEEPDHSDSEHIKNGLNLDEDAQILTTRHDNDESNDYILPSGILSEDEFEQENKKLSSERTSSSKKSKKQTTTRNVKAFINIQNHESDVTTGDDNVAGKISQASGTRKKLKTTGKDSVLEKIRNENARQIRIKKGTKALSSSSQIVTPIRKKKLPVLKEDKKNIRKKKRHVEKIVKN